MICKQIPYKGFRQITLPVLTFEQRVCYVFGIEKDDLVKKNNQRPGSCMARNLLYYYYRTIKGNTLKRSAALLGRKDHTSTSNGIKKFKDDYETNQEFRNKCKLLGIEI